MHPPRYPSATPRGHDRVKECQYYDHVGIKVCVKGDSHVRTEEKVKKARTALNMATCMGIRKGGLNMLTCCIIFWSVVVPTLCFGCELWVMSNKDVQILQAFQRYAARRIQRFHSRSLNATSRVCLGWIDIIRLIMVKKALFLRTIIMMEVHIPIRVVLIRRIVEFPLEGLKDNPYSSPITDILNTCASLDLTPAVKAMAAGEFYSKKRWKRLVWDNAWVQEMGKWHGHIRQMNGVNLIELGMQGPM